jgi:sugar-specific transcriptional regulator TrmB
MQINPSRIRNVRDKLEEALEEVERLLEEFEASRPPSEPPPRPTKVTRSRRTTRRISP